MSWVSYNGELIKEEEAKIPIKNKANFFDFSVYSSLKVIQNKTFFSKYHVDRLFESADLIGLGHDFEKEDVIKWINKLVEQLEKKDFLLRIILVGDAEKNKEAKLYIFPITGITYYPNEYYSKGVKTVTYKGERLIPKAKTTNLLLGFLALRKAKKNNALEALLVDSDGNIREGTRSNFFAIKNNYLITPPDEKVLEGITKKIVLKVTKDEFDLKKENIPLDKIANYDEFFITSTLFNVMPVKQIDGEELHSDFKKTKRIQKLFKDYYHENVLED